MRKHIEVLIVTGLIFMAAPLCGCAELEAALTELLNAEPVEDDTPAADETTAEDEWGAGCTYGGLPDGVEARAQYRFGGAWFSNPWVVSGLVAAAVVVPVALHDEDGPHGSDALRLAPNDWLRAACLDTCYLASDEEIVELLQIVEESRLAGMTRDEIDLCAAVPETDATAEHIALDDTGTDEAEDGVAETNADVVTDAWSSPDGLTPLESCAVCQEAILDQIYAWMMP